MTEQGCSQTGMEPVIPSHSKDDPQAIADRYEDCAVPCGQIGPTRIHLGYSFADVLRVAANYLVEKGRGNEWAESGVTVREYLQARFSVVSARIFSGQVRSDERMFREMLEYAVEVRAGQQRGSGQSARSVTDIF